MFVSDAGRFQLAGQAVGHAHDGAELYLGEG